MREAVNVRAYQNRIGNEPLRVSEPPHKADVQVIAPQERVSYRTTSASSTGVAISSGVLHVPWMDDRDVVVTEEILFVQRDEVADTVYLHGGHQVSVVHLNAPHSFDEDEASPFLMNLFVVDKESELALD